MATHPFQLESLETRRWRQDMCETYKYLHNLYTSNSDDLFELSDVQTRGHDYKLVKHYSRTDIRKNFFCNRIVTSWNSLPASTVAAPTLHTFKKRLRSLPTGKKDR